MQDADLFMELAAIAGVFVGFGALIAVRSGGASEPREVSPVRVTVAMGVVAIIGALAPVTLSRYDLTEHQVWALSAVLVLVGLVVMIGAMARTPEYRANWSVEMEAARTAQRPRWLVAVEGAAYVLGMLAWVGIPIIVVLGVAPDLDAAHPRDLLPAAHAPTPHGDERPEAHEHAGDRGQLHEQIGVLHLPAPPAHRDRRQDWRNAPGRREADGTRAPGARHHPQAEPRPRC